MDKGHGSDGIMVNQQFRVVLREREREREREVSRFSNLIYYSWTVEIQVEQYFKNTTLVVATSNDLAWNLTLDSKRLPFDISLK